jgi:exonuclease SbcC
LRIAKLQLRNVKSYGEDALDIGYADGVNFIAGRNGAGKSTQMEAIGFALFDVLPVTREEFLRRGAKSGSVTVWLEDGEERFRVVRKIGGDESWVVYDRDDVDLARGKADVLAFLCARFRAGDAPQLRNMYSNIVGVPQGMFTALFRMRGAERRKILDSIISVDAWRDAAEAHKDVKGRLLTAAIDDAEKRISLAAQFLDEHRDAPERLARVRARLTELGARIASVTARVDHLHAAQEELGARRRQIEALERRMAELEAKLAARRQAHDRAQAEVDRARRAAETCRESDAGRREYDAAERELTAFDGLEAVADRIEEAIDLLESAAGRESEAERLEKRAGADPGRRREAAASRVASIESRIDVMTSSRDDLAKEVCPFLQEGCDRVPPGTFERKLAPLRRDLAQAKAELAEAESAAAVGEKAAEARREAWHKREEAKRRLSGAPEWARPPANADRLEHALAMREEVARRRKALEAARARRDRARAAHSAWLENHEVAEELAERTAHAEAQRALIAESAEALERVKAERSGIEYDGAAAKRVAAELEAALEKRAAAERDREHASREQAELVRVVEERERQRAGKEKAERERRSLDRFRALLEDVWDILRKVGPRISRRLLAGISAQANRIFGELHGEHATLAWEADYAVRLRRSDADLPFHALSGGEQMSAALAIQMAMARAFAQSSFCVFDEPTIHLDEPAKDRLAAAIKHAQVAANFTQVFLVSHDDAFQPYVDHEIKLRKDDGKKGTIVE